MLRNLVLVFACFWTINEAVHLVQQAAPMPQPSGIQVSPHLLRSLLDLDVATHAIIGAPSQQRLAYSRAAAPASSLTPTQHMPMKTAATQNISPALLRNLMDIDGYGAGSLSSYVQYAVPQTQQAVNIAPSPQAALPGTQHMPVQSAAPVSISSMTLRNLLDLDVQRSYGGMANQGVLGGLSAYDPQTLGYANHFPSGGLVLDGGYDTYYL